MHYLLFYEVADDYISRRAEFRDAHLEKAWRASERGELILGGALADPVDKAVLLFKGDSPEVAAGFARADPYVTSGAVKRWYVRQWNTVAGEESATPIRPNSMAHREETDDSPRAPDAATPSEDKSPILRMWRGHATIQNAPDYIKHVTSRVFPSLQAIEGYRGVYLLRRALDGAVEFVVLTLWDSMKAIRKFAGAKPENAVVEPEAQAILTDFDESVEHFEVVHRS